MDYYEVMLRKQRDQLHADSPKIEKRNAILMAVIAALCAVLVWVAL